MLVSVTFKTPDAVGRTLESVPEPQREAAKKLMDKFISWGELVTIRFDTEAETATVIPPR